MIINCFGFGKKRGKPGARRSVLRPVEKYVLTHTSVLRHVELNIVETSTRRSVLHPVETYVTRRQILRPVKRYCVKSHVER